MEDLFKNVGSAGTPKSPATSFVQKVTPSDTVDLPVASGR